MGNFIRLDITGQENVMLEGVAYQEKEKLSEKLREHFSENPDAWLLVSPVEEEFYRGIGMVLYAGHSAGISAEKLRYRTQSGEIISFEELKARVM
jgi:hypothetical protein